MEKRPFNLNLRLRWKFSAIKLGSQSLSGRLKKSGLDRRIRQLVIHCPIHHLKTIHVKNSICTLSLLCLQCRKIFFITYSLRNFIFNKSAGSGWAECAKFSCISWYKELHPFDEQRLLKHASKSKLLWNWSFFHYIWKNYEIWKKVLWSPKEKGTLLEEKKGHSNYA